MNTLDQILAADWITRLGWTLLHSLWEIALVTAVLALLLSLLRRGSANVRYLAACGGLTVMAIAPIVTFGILPDHQAPDLTVPAVAKESTSEPVAVVPAEDSTAVEDAMANTGVSVSGRLVEEIPAALPHVTSAGPATPLPTAGVPPDEPQKSSLQPIAAVISPWMPWCVVIWFVGVFALSLWNLGGWIAAQRLKRLGTHPVAEDISHRLSTLAERSGINRSVTVMKSLMVEVPVVVGWLRPVVLLPAGILTGLTPAELDAVLAHELAHIRRHDYLVNLLQTVIETLLFYHPAVWWLSRQIRAEREHCCDDAAVAVSGNKVDYASALAAVEAGRAAPKMVMAARKTDSGTLSRIRRVLGAAGNRPSRWGRSLASGLITSAMIVTLVTCFVIAGGGTEANVSKAETVSAEAAEQNDPIAELIEQLADDDRTWTAAVTALQRLGEPAVEELVAALENKNPRVRRGAVQALGEIKVASAIDPLIEILNDPETAIRIDAATGLGNLASYDTKDLRPSRLIPALAAALKDEDRQVRGAAAWALWQSNDPRAVQPLLEALQDEHPAVRWRAAEGLGYLRAKAAVEPLMAALRSDNQTLRSHAANALGRIGDRRPLSRLYALASDDEDAGVRAAAGEALRLIEYPQTQLRPVVWGEPVDGLQAGVRCTSGMAPYRYGEIVHYEVLVRNTTDKPIKLAWVANGWSPMVQGNRIELLGSCVINGIIAARHSTVPPHGEESTHTIRYVVRPPDWNTRDSLRPLHVGAGKYGVSASFHSHPHDPKVKDVWQGTLPTGELSLTVVTEEVVGETEDESAVQDRIKELIEACGGHEVGRVRHMTVITVDTDETRELVEIGRPAVRQLVEALKDPNKHIRRHAAFVLGKIGDADAVEPLLECCRAEKSRNAKSGQWDNDVLEPASQAATKLLYPERAYDANWIYQRARTIDELSRTVVTEEVVGKTEDESTWDKAAAETPLPKMISESSDAVGVTFDRPADWIVDKEPPPHNGPGVDFLQPWSLVDGVQASLRVSMAENGGKAAIDVTSPPDPKATASRTFEIDGEPARLTAFTGKGDAEFLTVQVAQGTRSYVVQMVFPRKRRDEYLRLAFAVCESMRFYRWGEAVKGVRARLRPGPVRDGEQWAVFELQNDSTDLFVELNPGNVPKEILVDGVSYGWTGDIPTGWPLPVFKPGQSTAGREFKLDEKWMAIAQDNGSPNLELKPGKHTVQAVVYATAQGDVPTNIRLTRVVSNPIDIEIVSEEGDKELDGKQPDATRSGGSEPVWGKPVKGVRAALVAEKPVPGGDTMPAFQLRLQNDRSVMPGFSKGLHNFALELDGRRYRLEIIDNGKLGDLPIGFNENTGNEEFYQFRFQQQDGRLTMNRYVQAGSFIVSLESYRLVAVDPETDQPAASHEARLTPGKHAIRVGVPIINRIISYPAYAADRNCAPLRAWSNAVESEVVSEDAGGEKTRVSPAVSPLGSVFTIDRGPGRDGAICGKVIGPKKRDEAAMYSVTLDHEEWTNRLGELPHLVVAAGEPFEFRNVPAGKCKVRAQAVTASGQNAGAAAMSAEVEVTVKNKRVVEVELKMAAAENTDTTVA